MTHEIGMLCLVVMAFTGIGAGIVLGKIKKWDATKGWDDVVYTFGVVGTTFLPFFFVISFPHVGGMPMQSWMPFGWILIWLLVYYILVYVTHKITVKT